MLSVSGGVVLLQVGGYSGGEIMTDLGSAARGGECCLSRFRECQVKHWSKHKKACQLLAEASEKMKSSLDMACSSSAQ